MVISINKAEQKKNITMPRRGRHAARGSNALKQKVTWSLRSRFTSQRGKHLEKHTKTKHMNRLTRGKDSITHLSSRRNKDKCLSSTVTA